MADSISQLAARLGVHRYQPLKFALDLALWTLITPFVFIIRLEAGYLRYAEQILVYIVIGGAVKAILILYFALHRQSWHKVGVLDLYAILRAGAASTLLLFAIGFILNPHYPIPRSIPILDSLLGVMVLGGVRLVIRLIHEQNMRHGVLRQGRRVLVIGAGEAGTMIVREMLRHPEAGLHPVAYLDDEPRKHGSLYFGVPVAGQVDKLPDVAHRLNVQEVLIAMPSASGEAIRRVVQLAREAGVRYRIIPGFYDILSGKVSIAQIREVDVEDLLRRDVIHLNQDEIASYLAGREVLVTGAGGSIGSEIVRQMIRFIPKRLILIDRDENNLYMFERELVQNHAGLNYKTVVADIQRKDKLDHIFDMYRPQVVFHAAAHKHVPVMEQNPDEAIFNNVVGTLNLLEMASKYHVERFVNISTDKAVRPTSIMGATKRVAEYLVERAARNAASGQAFVSVRFGNVLGSRGSVVPLFKEQIQHGGPVTVTHPDMTRYFMSIPEASQLVLQAAALGENGVVYILDMGEPVKILDLAHELIRLSGFDPDTDIAIQFVGIRPGEKLYEELLTAEEDTMTTKHEQIYVVRKTGAPVNNIDGLLTDLLTAAKSADTVQIQAALKSLVPTYEPHTNHNEPVSTS